VSDKQDKAEKPAPGGPQPQQDSPPPRVKPRIIAAPKIRQLYWRDAQLPEMWKARPVVVVSYRNTLHGPCLVVPTTTEPQSGNPWALKLTTSIDGRNAWAICNQPSTIASSWLFRAKGKVPCLSEAEFKEVLALLLRWLPRPLKDLSADA
jgi:mRNA interferase MazF